MIAEEAEVLYSIIVKTRGRKDSRTINEHSWQEGIWMEKRKKIIRVKLSEIKDIVKFNEKYTGKKINKYFLCIDEVNNPDAYAFVFYNEARGNCAAVMLPNEKILKGMRPKLLPEMQLKVVKMLREK